MARKKVVNPDRLDLDTIPIDVKEVMRVDTSEEDDSLHALGTYINGLWEEAKKDRAASGIEDIWIECEEAYLGMDDSNRSEFSKAKWIKPPTKEGPLIAASRGRGKRGASVQSTAFVRLTSRYVDAGYAKLCEILLPIDDKAFSLSATPVPDIIKSRQDESQVVHQGIPLERSARPEEQSQVGGNPLGGGPPLQPPGAAPPETPTVPLKVKDLAEEKMNLANQKAKAAEKRIADWLVECQYHAEMRKIIFDMARIGIGVIKAPYTVIRKAMSVTEDGEMQTREVTAPAACWVNPWDIFPSPGCGENIQEANWTFERKTISKRQLIDLANDEEYIADQIELCVKEGPNKINIEPSNPRKDIPHNNRDIFEIRYFYGMIKRKSALKGIKNEDVKAQVEDMKDAYVHAVVTMVNDHVIRATVNPLESGELPYHSIPWQRRVGNWAGVGVAEQIFMPQRLINAATRSMINNAGKSAGAQIVIDRDAITPADGDYTLTPEKIWYKSAGSLMDDVRKAFMSVQIPNMTVQLMKVIEYAFRLAEESTSIPLITQGQSGTTTPETYGATQLQNNNANQLLRSVAYTVDDYCTEPIIRKFYQWLLTDPEVPDDEKGDFQISAHGSIAMVERSIQDQTIMQMGAMVINPAFGIDPKKWFKMMAKSKHLNPVDLQYTEEEMARIAATPPPPPPTVMAAQERGKTDIQIAQMKFQDSEATRQIGLQKIQTDLDRDTAYVQAQTEKNQLEHAAHMEEIRLKHETALLENATKRGISIDQVKSELAQTAMSIQAQKQIAHDNMAIDYHKHENPKPKIEPAGKAKNGQAFAQ